MNKLASLFTQTAGPEAYAAAFMENLGVLLRALDAGSIARLAGLIENAIADDKTIFVAGNGGSAAVANHACADLSINSLKDGCKPCRAVSLSCDPGILTAAGNDIGFDDIFAVQLQAHMRPGDLVIVMSVSGNSPNILRAAAFAKEHGATVAGLAGFPGSKLPGVCDLAIIANSTPDEYGPDEDVFSAIMHCVSGYITMKRGRFLSHD